MICYESEIIPATVAGLAAAPHPPLVAAGSTGIGDSFFDLLFLPAEPCFLVLPAIDSNGVPVMNTRFFKLCNLLLTAIGKLADHCQNWREHESIPLRFIQQNITRKTQCLKMQTPFSPACFPFLLLHTL